MAKEKYEPPKIEILNKKDEPVDITPSHGNTRLPFGLCMRYGIAIGKDWTPRDAWDALAGKGITPDEVYSDVKKDGKVNEVKAEPEQPKEVEKPKKNYVESSELTEYEAFNYCNDEAKTYCRESYETGTEEAKEMLSKLLDLSKGTIFYAKGSEDECHMLQGDITLTLQKEGEGTLYAKGDSFWHETFHIIDGNHRGDNYDYKAKGASSTIAVKDGKTMTDIVSDELRKGKKSGLFKRISVDKADYEMELIKKSVDYEDFKKEKEKWEAADKKIMDEEMLSIKTYRDAYYEGRISYRQFDAVRAPVREAANRKIKESHENADYKKYSEMLSKIYNAKAKAERDYGTVSDICSSYGYEVGALGHKASYWSKGGINARAHEAFANLGGNMACAPEQYAMTKKYFPETVEAFEILIGKMRSGELKTRKERGKR